MQKIIIDLNFQSLNNTTIYVQKKKGGSLMRREKVEKE